jgi:hypothetical protein
MPSQSSTQHISALTTVAALPLLLVCWGDNSVSLIQKFQRRLGEQFELTVSFGSGGCTQSTATTASIIGQAIE